MQEHNITQQKQHKITKKGCSTILPTHPHECYIINFIPSSTMLLDNEWKVKVIHSSQQNFLYQAFCVRRRGCRRRREKMKEKQRHREVHMSEREKNAHIQGHEENRENERNFPTPTNN